MLWRVVNIIVAVALVLSVIVIPAAGSSTQTSEFGRAQLETWLPKLAAALGRDADQLQGLTAQPLTLLNGKTLQLYKALDLNTHEIVGATFDGDRVVDEQAEREAAGKEWRAQHGAVTPQLLQQLAQLKPGEKLDISIWLKADIQSLPRPSDTAVNSEAGRETAAMPIGLATKAPQTDRTEKIPASPISIDQLPPDVRARLSGVSQNNQPAAPDQSKLADATRPNTVPDRSTELARTEAYKQQNDAAIKAQVAPVRAHFLDLMRARGLAVAYASEIVPTAVINGVTREQIEALAFLPEIDAIYAVPKQAGPSLANARPTQNMALVNDAGYKGSGVNVSVTEGERGYAANPYLTWSNFYNGSAPYADHPTAVGGMIKSTAPGFYGLANGVNLYSANGSYTTWATMAAAMDWGMTNATVLNNSWYWDTPNNPLFWEADRRQDYYMRYNYDFVSVATGNFGNGCGSNFTSYVPSPAKGFNVMSVGNYEDNNTLGWPDDAMDTCSSFGDPAGDTSGQTHRKPEVSAVGSTISSTLPSSSALITQSIGGVGSGTSYASPMVVSLAADIIQAQPGFADEPERIKAIIMASALHNIEGAAKFSDIDGAGGIDGTAALTIVERGENSDQGIDSSTTFPITKYQFAYKGERVRFVIVWLSDPAGDYTSDALPADLDLTAFRADGTTVMDSSASVYNGFEIVDFVAPASETYQFRISKFSYTGSNTWLGTAAWRGTYRISPDTGYSDPKATPLGTHLSVYPTDWSPANYWRAFGIRPVGSDHDLELYSRSQFDDPSQRTLLEGSYNVSGTVDLITVDGNHWPSANEEQYLVTNFDGDGGYRLNWSDQGITLFPGLYGPFTMGSSEVVKVFDVWFYAGQPLGISVIPGGSNAS
ncbi:MAG TPA: S8 family serine peptidase, partial [Anaerolineae bacterium]|nr:S8 family serine peptidase [Anaerolineae bacterium]